VTLFSIDERRKNVSEAKIEIQIGAVRFAGEGEQQWLTQQLDKILNSAKDLIKLAPPSAPTNQNSQTQHQAADFSNSTAIASQSLASFLKSKNATSAQVDKFLAAAIWVEAKENKNRLKTSDISRALKNAGQTKLNNPALTLIQNVSKGYCEKDGKDFFVTQEGKDKMGV
jgi:hypothetical protein